VLRAFQGVLRAFQGVLRAFQGGIEALRQKAGWQLSLLCVTL
jgi:hypothetical protein